MIFFKSFLKTIFFYSLFGAITSVIIPLLILKFNEQGCDGGTCVLVFFLTPFLFLAFLSIGLFRFGWKSAKVNK